MGAQQSNQNDEFEILTFNEKITFNNDIYFNNPQKFHNAFDCSETIFDNSIVPINESESIVPINDIIFIKNEDNCFINKNKIIKKINIDPKKVNYNHFYYNKDIDYFNDYYEDEGIPDFKELNRKKYNRNHYKKYNYNVEVQKRFNEIIRLKNFNQLEGYLRNLVFHYKKK